MEAPLPPAAGLPGEPTMFLDAQIAALDYRERLLSRAEDRSLPLLERVKFLTVFDRAFDAFFQVEMARLQGGAAGGDDRAQGVLRAAGQRARALHGRAWAAVAEVLGGLAGAGIVVSRLDALRSDEREWCLAWFADRVLPALEARIPPAPTGPFPHVAGGERHLLVELLEPGTARRLRTAVALPDGLPRLVALPEPGRFTALDDIVGTGLPSLYPGLDVAGAWSFHVTRPAEAKAAPGGRAADLVSTVREELEQRRTSAHAVRLEIDADADPAARAALASDLGVEDIRIYTTPGPIGAGSLAPLLDLDRPDLEPPRRVPPAASRPGLPEDVFDLLSQTDVLVHHPYEAFDSSVEAFLARAAADPDVVAIKQTLYRMSGPVNPVAESLIRAAEAGKDVLALVEIRARFDEETNIEWARTLERAGVHVVHGVLGMKTHAKIALVVRREGGALRRYSHIGTGNYNSDTARQYEDVGLLTSDPALGADLTDLFNVLSGQGRPSGYRKLLVSPAGLRPALMRLIRGQARPEGRIAIKVNNLVDRPVIAELAAASQAGADVDLIVRSTCCLRPGVPGRTEGIAVRSIIGGYLEHSRIFRFGEGAAATYLIGSADLMPRNLDQRIEALAPVEHPGLRARIDTILEVALADDVLAWELGLDGTWRPPRRTLGVDVQAVLAARAHDTARFPVPAASRDRETVR